MELIGHCVPEPCKPWGLYTKEYFGIKDFKVLGS